MKHVRQRCGVFANRLYQLVFSRPVVASPDHELGAGSAVAPVVVGTVLFVEQDLVAKTCGVRQLIDQYGIVACDARRSLK